LIVLSWLPKNIFEENFEERGIERKEDGGVPSSPGALPPARTRYLM
jgi:hypothetical protein